MAVFRKILTYIVAPAIVAAMLLGGVWIFGREDSVLRLGTEGGSQARLEPEGDGPIPILPRQPDGVTIALKQTEAPGQVPAPPPAPVARGADAPTGFAMDLGAAQSFSELSARFAEIAAINAEAGFDRLEPRATLRDTDRGLEARLLVGPFAMLEDAESACLDLALPQDIECAVVPFEGELIARD